MSGNENDGLDASEVADEETDTTTEPPAEADESAEAEEPVEDDQLNDASAESDAEEVEEAEESERASEGDGEEPTGESGDSEADPDDEIQQPAQDEDVLGDEDADLLIPVEDYLGAGVHIGTQQQTEDMSRFIHRVRTDGLYVLDISMTDKRIRTAANFLENYDPEQILVASSRQYGRFPAEKFAEAVGARARTGRFIPGTLTNPTYEGYIEPDVVVVTDPIGDAQAVKEAITVGIPVIAMCDSNNTTGNVDLVVPTNNKGRKALSVVYWLLANETLDRRGADSLYGLEDFESEL